MGGKWGYPEKFFSHIIDALKCKSRLGTVGPSENSLYENSVKVFSRANIE